MTTFRGGRVQELSESSYLMLRDTYHMVRELKGMVDRMHQSGLMGSGTSFDQVAAVKLSTDRLYDELERYMRPECDPDCAVAEAMTEPAGE